MPQLFSSDQRSISFTYAAVPAMEEQGSYAPGPSPEEDAQPASTGEQQALERKKIFLAAGEYARLRVRKDTTTQNILEEESFSYNAVGEMISRTLTIGKTVRPPPMPMKWGAICTR